MGFKDLFRRNKVSILSAIVAVSTLAAGIQTVRLEYSQAQNRALQSEVVKAGAGKLLKEKEAATLSEENANLKRDPKVIERLQKEAKERAEARQKWLKEYRNADAILDSIRSVLNDLRKIIADEYGDMLPNKVLEEQAASGKIDLKKLKVYYDILNNNWQKVLEMFNSGDPRLTDIMNIGSVSNDINSILPRMYALLLSNGIAVSEPYVVSK